MDLPVVLVDHDLATRGDPVGAVARVPAAADAIYRGWMLRSQEYAAFATALDARGTTLRTSAEQYRRAHELPGWYATLGEFTPESVWTEGADDYTKSMKHYWHEAAFIPDLSDADAAWAIATRFLELRGDSFVGGIVLRRFEHFDGAEARTW